MPIKEGMPSRRSYRHVRAMQNKLLPAAAGPAPQPAQGAHTIEMWISSRSVLRRGYEPLCPMPGLLAFGSLTGLVGITLMESERGWVRFIHTLASKRWVTTKTCTGNRHTLPSAGFC